jgi:tRNA modification GTPase
MIFGDSIVALSSGRLPAGVAVIRVSGPHSRFVVETIAGVMPAERTAAYRKLVTSKGEILDRALVLFFVGPNSFTGEDVVEFQVHGGPAVVAAILRTITALPGLRSADPGEFTRRAFLNGKLDLVQTEALADLVNAETEAQRRFALRNADGAQSTLYADWRRRLIHARAMIEADIDFADEDDVPGSVANTVWSDVSRLAGEIAEHVKGFATAEIIQDGFDVVILGAPNAGKSSLFNALARREAAIVSDEPGTTRDLLEVLFDIEGFKVRITDTAGLREGAGKVETIGIERARAKGGRADLVLALEDMSNPARVDTDWLTVPTIRVGTKLDLIGTAGCRAAAGYDMCVSAVSGDGLAELVEALGRHASERVTGSSDVLPSKLRHVELLEETIGHLQSALAGEGQALELRAEELRLAADRLGRIVGSVDVEDLLDVIFSQFCIGK